MSDYSVIIGSRDIRDTYEELPDRVREGLASHFDKIHTARSLRKLPYPAHRNRGVTLRYEDESIKVSLHVARDDERNIEILGLIQEIRDLKGMKDYEAVQSMRCPLCARPPGSVCRLPGGEMADRPHLERRKAMEKALSRPEAQSGRATVWALNGREIFEVLTDSRDTSAAWNRSFDAYRALKGADADLMLKGAAVFVGNRNPERLWTPSGFRLFVEESVSGPYVSPLQVATEWVRRDRGLRRMTEIEARTYLTNAGPIQYAQKIGAVFARLEDGRILAVENPGVVDS